MPSLGGSLTLSLASKNFHPQAHTPPTSRALQGLTQELEDEDMGGEVVELGHTQS
jgi:hypothetical protein